MKALDFIFFASLALVAQGAAKHDEIKAGSMNLRLKRRAEETVTLPQMSGKGSVTPPGKIVVQVRLVSLRNHSHSNNGSIIFQAKDRPQDLVEQHRMHGPRPRHQRGRHPRHRSGHRPLRHHRHLQVPSQVMCQM